MAARIYETVKSAMQSGHGKAGHWRLDFVPSEARVPDPLMGWAGSGDTRQQVSLTFDTREAAENYARERGLDYSVITATPTRLKLQSYADNFR